MARLSVAVIFGGRSVEHDVSIVTAHQVMAVLAASHDVVPIYVTREGRWLTSPRLNDLEVYKEGRWDAVGEEAHLPPGSGTSGLYIPAMGRLSKARRVPIDVVIPSIHGTFGEDGTLQGLLDLADVPYAGSSTTASALGMDKISMKGAFKAAGLNVVDDVVVKVENLDRDPSAIVSKVESSLGFPVFVKPAKAGSSVGIASAADAEGLLAALDVARRYDRRILVERSMKGCAEINCSVLGGAGHEPVVSVCDQPVAWEEFLTFSDKYLRGGKGAKSEGMASQERKIPAPIPDEQTKRIQSGALAAFEAIGASGVARIDSFLDESTGESWVMEINTVPGSFAFYLWEHTGIPFSELMQRLINIALAEHAARSELLFTFDSEMLDRFGGAK